MSADANMRKAVGKVPPGLDFPPVELVAAPSLDDATVALVTTAALAHPGEPWEDQSHEYRLFDRDERGLIMAHNSTNLDRSGFALDRNVAYPIDRLLEMEKEGRIGKVAPRHASFIGSTFELSTFLFDTGPRLAATLRGDGADVALLTPV
ncbi:MAG: selenoprotein B glycine/betaine/sarcosine/D-proline reductase [bacterium]|nr:selenoprotein B glycine/betaine/sarcosine/D-proline reductase [Deltaproteobacteria bacterium]MCP4908149.1 selenoprotein B glycine/betaine/sarcosine/D-proline reductase [bacterium]